MNGFAGKSLIAGIGAIALAIGVSFSAVSAQAPPPGQGPMRMHRGPGGPFGPGPGPGGPLGPAGFMLRQLDLTEAQRGQIKAVVDGHKPDFGEIGKRMREARKRLQAAMQAPVVDEVAIRAASADVAAVEADANVLRATVRVEVFNILTPEQRTKAAELKAKAEARRAVMGERMKARRAQRPQGGF